MAERIYGSEIERLWKSFDTPAARVVGSKEWHESVDWTNELHRNYVAVRDDSSPTGWSYKRTDPR